MILPNLFRCSNTSDSIPNDRINDDSKNDNNDINYNNIYNIIISLTTVIMINSCQVGFQTA